MRAHLILSKWTLPSSLLITMYDLSFKQELSTIHQFILYQASKQQTTRKTVQQIKNSRINKKTTHFPPEVSNLAAISSTKEARYISLSSQLGILVTFHPKVIITKLILSLNLQKCHFGRKFKKIFRALKIPEFNWKCFADARYNFF